VSVVFVVVSLSKPADEVTSPSASHQLGPPDSRTDPTVSLSPSDFESVARPQTSSYDEPYSQPERLYYDAASPRSPLPSQSPSGMLSD